MKIGYLMQAGVPDVRRDPYSGPASHVRHVFNELRGLGHDVRLLAQFGRQIWKSDDLTHYDPVHLPSFDDGLWPRFESVARRIQAVAHLPYAALFDSLRFAAACRKSLGDRDLLFERMGWMGWGGGVAATRLGIPLVLEVNGDHQQEMAMLKIAPRGLQLQLSKTLMRRAVRRATHLVATGEGWRQSCVDTWSIDPATITVIENGSAIVEQLERAQLRAFRTPASSAEPVTVVYLGGFEVWHGVTVLVRAVAKAIHAGVRLRLVLTGSGTQGPDIARLIDELSIGEYVRRSPPKSLEEVAKDLAAADLGAAPYCRSAEFSGLKVIDYKAAGLVAIVSGRNGHPRVIQHGQTGWIVPPGDVDALCEALTHMAANADLRRTIGRQSRIDAEAHHRWQHTAQRLQQVFDNVVAR